MKCIQVLPILKHTFSEELTYWTVHDFSIGDMIQVELNHRKIFAIVSSIVSLSEAKEFIKSREFKIKKIETSVKLDFFSREFILSCLYTSRYYVRSFGEILSEYIPKKILEELDVNMSSPERSARVKKSQSSTSTEVTYIQKGFLERIAYIQNLQKDYEHICMVVPTDAHKKHIQKHISDIRIITPIELYLLDTYTAELCILEFAGSEYYRHVRKDFDTRATVRSYCDLASIPLIEMDAILPLYAQSDMSHIDSPITAFPEIHIVDQTVSKSAKVKKTAFEKSKKKNIAPDDFDIRLIMENSIDFVTHKKLNLVSPELYSLIVYAEKQKEDIFIYTTRKGLSSSVTCSDCGHVLICAECKKPYALKLVQGVRSYVCPGGHIPLPTDTACPICGNMHLTLLGSGTDAIHAELIETISQPIIIVDGDHMTQAGARNIFKKRKDKDHVPAVYIGTELALHQGLDESFTYSAIASLETLLALPSRIAELEAARVVEALREKTTHTIVIQTRNPNHLVWKSVQDKNWKGLIEHVAQDAEELQLPPFATYIRLHISARYKTAFNDMVGIERYLKEYPHISIVHTHDDIAGEYIHMYLKDWPDDGMHRYMKSLPPYVHIQVDSPTLM
ncbi:MAG: hypothetical protein V4576_03850 [Patescibacteria group bacterium]